MIDIRFYSLLSIILCAVFFLCFETLTLIHHDPSLFDVFYTYLLIFCQTFLSIGLGLGLVMIFIAALLGLLQFILLIMGNIHPHLAHGGLLKVLNTLFSKL